MAYATLAWLPWAVGEYQTHVLTTCSYYVILAVGWNLLAGFTGQFSLAHHTFAGIGAYTSAFSSSTPVAPLFVGIVAGVVVAAAIGWSLGTLCLRMRAIYLALATWAFAESIRLLITVEYQVTRGDLGLATPFLFGTPRPTAYYYVFLGLAVVAVLVAWQIVHSRVGTLHARHPRRRGGGRRHGGRHLQVEAVGLRNLRRSSRRSRADFRATTSVCCRPHR